MWRQRRRRRPWACLSPSVPLLPGYCGEERFQLLLDHLRDLGDVCTLVLGEQGGKVVIGHEGLACVILVHDEVDGRIQGCFWHEPAHLIGKQGIAGHVLDGSTGFTCQEMQRGMLGCLEDRKIRLFPVAVQSSPLPPLGMPAQRPGLGYAVRSAATLPLSPFGSEGPQGLSHRVGSTRSPRGRWLSTGGVLRASSGPAPFLSHLRDGLAYCLWPSSRHQPF